MTFLRVALVAFAAGAMVTGTPMAAQSEGEADEGAGDDIVVTGKVERPSSSAVSQQAREITVNRSSMRHSPMARIEDRLCPGIVGMKLEHAQFMVDRIRWNAERVDVPLASEDGCNPNLIVAFVDDGKAELAALNETNREMFSAMPFDEKQALLAETGPVRVWTTTVNRTRDGMALMDNGDGSPPVLNTWMAHSKIYLAVRKDIAQVVVLFDKRGIMGKSLVQLADYASMRGFAMTKPVEGEAAMGTILALFDPNGEAPQALTDFDQAYLRSLYEGIPNLRGISRLVGVNRELNQLERERDRASE